MRLGELLIQKGLLKPEQLEKALEEQERSGEFLGAILVALRFVTEDDLLHVLSEQFNIPVHDLKKKPVDWTAAMKFTPSLVVDRQCLPIAFNDTGYTVAIRNPLDVEAVSRAEEQARGRPVRLVLITAEDMREALSEYKKRKNVEIRKLLS